MDTVDVNRQLIDDALLASQPAASGQLANARTIIRRQNLRKPEESRGSCFKDGNGGFIDHHDSRAGWQRAGADGMPGWIQNLPREV